MTAFANYVFWISWGMSTIIFWGVTYFDCQRKQYLSRDLLSKYNTFKFERLMNARDIRTLFKQAKLCKDFLNTFKEIHKVIG